MLKKLEEVNLQNFIYSVFNFFLTSRLLNKKNGLELKNIAELQRVSPSEFLSIQ